MRIIKAQVYDPYLDGVATIPPRLELIVTEQDFDNPTHTEQRYGWEVAHFGKFLEFDRITDSLEYIDEGDFNDDMVLNEPVFPATVSMSGQMWSEMYMKVSKVRKLLRKIGSTWECVPDPIFLQKHIHRWTLINTDYVCQECKRIDKATNAEFESATKGRRVQINDAVAVTLCEKHETEHNQRLAAARTGHSGN